MNIKQKIIIGCFLALSVSVFASIFNAPTTMAYTCSGTTSGGAPYVYKLHQGDSTEGGNQAGGECYEPYYERKNQEAQTSVVNGQTVHTCPDSSWTLQGTNCTKLQRNPSKDKGPQSYSTSHITNNDGSPVTNVRCGDNTTPEKTSDGGFTCTPCRTINAKDTVTTCDSARSAIPTQADSTLTKADQQKVDQQNETTAKSNYLNECKASGKSDADCQSELDANIQGCQREINNNTYKNMSDCLNRRTVYDYGQCKDGSKVNISTGKCADGSDPSLPTPLQTGTQQQSVDVKAQDTSDVSSCGTHGTKNTATKTVLITSSNVTGACSGNGITLLGGLLKFVMTTLSIGVGIVAVGGIAYGSILYASARANAGQVQKGIGVIRNVVIGVLLYIFMVAILNYLVPGVIT
jgi:hypothetical protein